MRDRKRTSKANGKGFPVHNVPDSWWVVTLVSYRFIFFLLLQQVYFHLVLALLKWRRKKNRRVELWSENNSTLHIPTLSRPHSSVAILDRIADSTSQLMWAVYPGIRMIKCKPFFQHYLAIGRRFLDAILLWSNPDNSWIEASLEYLRNLCDFQS